MASKGIYEIAIMARVEWGLHSLNNEGNVGSAMQPRTVKLADGTTTDGISGEMLKHVHFEYLWGFSEENNLCEGCKTKRPDRFSKELANLETPDKQNPNVFALSSALAKCDICDLHGFLFTEGKYSTPRNSTLEFGWAFAIGEEDKHPRDVHLHTRNDPEKSATGEEKSAQMVYYRPTRSGIYAVVSLFQPWRIALEEIKSFDYQVKADIRLRRFRNVLKAYQAMFLRTEGAMTTTRLPHLMGIEGIVVYSTEVTPVPVLSPAIPDYVEQVKGLGYKLIGNGIEVKDFSDINSFAALIKEVHEGFVPYDIKTRKTE